MKPSLKIITGDCRNVLRDLPEKSVHCCVTSPPYWGLRQYLFAPQIGMEPTPQEYVKTMVQVFAYVWRALRDDGTLWLNLGDSYAGSWGAQSREHAGKHAPNISALSANQAKAAQIRASGTGSMNRTPGLKPKDLCGIPWRVAFALQEAGWYLRQWMPWIKRNPMPESTTDRPSVSCETFFLLSKSESYFYDYDAVKLPGSMALAQQVADGYNGKATKDFDAAGAQDASAVKSRIINGKRKSDKQRGHSRKHAGFNDQWDAMEKEEQCGGWRATRNSDWFFESIAPMLLNDQGNPLAMVVNPTGFNGAHFATFPPDLIKPCILSGCPTGGTVLDPFGGSGTTGQVALELGRSAILIELNPDYVGIAQHRTNVTPGLAL